jgi:hypothetical protein
MARLLDVDIYVFLSGVRGSRMMDGFSFSL